MKTTATELPLRRRAKPILKWQTGEYDRYAAFSFILPYQFLLLCKLVDITPRKMVLDFMDNLSCGSVNREGRDKAKEHLVNYFITLGYGQQYYTDENIRNIFKEMDALGLLFPADGKLKTVNLYAKWRDKHHNYFFKKWFRKPRRKLSQKEVS